MSLYIVRVTGVRKLGIGDHWTRSTFDECYIFNTISAANNKVSTFEKERGSYKQLHIEVYSESFGNLFDMRDE